MENLNITTELNRVTEIDSKISLRGDDTVISIPGFGGCSRVIIEVEDNKNKIILAQTFSNGPMIKVIDKDSKYHESFHIISGGEKINRFLNNKLKEEFQFKLEEYLLSSV
jgi:hypothetical protein